MKKYVLKTATGPKTYRIDYDGELNEEQKAVVLAGGGRSSSSRAQGRGRPARSFTAWRGSSSRARTRPGSCS